MVNDNNQHHLSLQNREHLLVTGVRNIFNYDDVEIFLETSMGTLVLKGVGLNIVNLDLKKGELSVSGKINEIAYTEKAGKGKKRWSQKGLIRRMFQ